MTRAAYAYGVVVLPPPDLYRELLAIRERHPLLRTPAPPHITVKSPFLFRFSGATVVEQLEEICDQFGPFELSIGGLGVFESGVLYVRVDQSEELSDLHYNLVQGLEGYVETLSGRYDGTGFTPHLTLADKLAPGDLREARRLLQDVRFRRRFRVNQIHLLRGKGRWDIARSFPLGACGY